MNLKKFILVNILNKFKRFSNDQNANITTYILHLHKLISISSPILLHTYIYVTWVHKYITGIIYLILLLHLFDTSTYFSHIYIVDPQLYNIYSSLGVKGKKKLKKNSMLLLIPCICTIPYRYKSSARIFIIRKYCI